MRVYNAFLTVIAVAVIAAWSCPSPTNIEGVAFTDEEQIHLELLTQLGTENVNYFKDGEEPYVAIRYVGHYSPKAMVYIGNYGLSYQEEVHMNCMGVIIPLDDSSGTYDPIDPATFDFPEAVRVELEWLAAKGVVELSAEMIATVDPALSEATNGGVQYWTHAGTVLGYNSWYNYDEQAGVWQGGDGVDGVNSVRGVKGVYGGCSIVSVAFEMPPEELGPAANLRRRFFAPADEPEPVQIRTVADGFILYFAHPVSQSGSVTIVNASGSVIARLGVKEGTRSLQWSFSQTAGANGVYFVVSRPAGRRSVVRVLNTSFR